MINAKKTQRILLVEDELIIAAHVSKVLSDHGHTVINVIRKGEEVIKYIAHNTPDLIIMDINLAGQLDGIETAKIIADTHNIPVIFLTANVDDGTFEKSKEAFPYAFIAKPFKPEELLRTIDLIISRINHSFSITTNEENTHNNKPMKVEAIFIRDKQKMVKVNFSDIHYVEADRNYSKVHTTKKVFLLSSPLIKVENKINSDVMQRIHRSYLVNTSLIDELDDNYVFINGQAIPISKTYKKELNNKIKFI